MTTTRHTRDMFAISGDVLERLTAALQEEVELPATLNGDRDYTIAVDEDRNIWIRGGDGASAMWDHRLGGWVDLLTCLECGSEWFADEPAWFTCCQRHKNEVM